MSVDWVPVADLLDAVLAGRVARRVRWSPAVLAYDVRHRGATRRRPERVRVTARQPPDDEVGTVRRGGFW